MISVCPFVPIVPESRSGFWFDTARLEDTRETGYPWHPPPVISGLAVNPGLCTKASTAVFANLAPGDLLRVNVYRGLGGSENVDHVCDPKERVGTH